MRPHLYHLIGWRWLSTVLLNHFFLKITFRWALDDGKVNLNVKTGEVGHDRMKCSVSMWISLNSIWTCWPTPTRFFRSFALAQLSLFFCLQSFTTCHSPNTFLFLSGHSDLSNTVVAVTVTLSHSNIYYLTLHTISAFLFPFLSSISFLLWSVFLVGLGDCALFSDRIALPEAIPMGIFMSRTFFLDFYCIYQV